LCVFAVVWGERRREAHTTDVFVTVEFGRYARLDFSYHVQCENVKDRCISTDKWIRNVTNRMSFARVE
jgi:hypothetical protein